MRAILLAIYLRERRPGMTMSPLAQAVARTGTRLLPTERGACQPRLEAPERRSPPETARQRLKRKGGSRERCGTIATRSPITTPTAMMTLKVMTVAAAAATAATKAREREAPEVAGRRETTATSTVVRASRMPWPTEGSPSPAPRTIRQVRPSEEMGLPPRQRPRRLNLARDVLRQAHPACLLTRRILTRDSSPIPSTWFRLAYSRLPPLATTTRALRSRFILAFSSTRSPPVCNYNQGSNPTRFNRMERSPLVEQALESR